MMKKSFDRKLFDASDMEGRINSEKLANLHELERRLETDPDFVGIAVYGSVVGGYSNENSDIDIEILYDDWFPGNSGQKLRKIVKDFCNEKKLETSISPNIQEWTLNIHMESIFKALDKTNSNVIRWRVIEGISYLFMKVMGKKINEYRRQLALFFQALPPEERESLKNEIIEELCFKENLRMEKFKQRIPGIQEIEEEFSIARKDLWKRRVENLLNPDFIPDV